MRLNWPKPSWTSLCAFEVVVSGRCIGELRRDQAGSICRVNANCPGTHLACPVAESYACFSELMYGVQCMRMEFWPLSMAAILDLVPINYLSNACWLVRFFGASLGVINLHHVPLLPNPYLLYTHRQRPNCGHMPCLALPLFITAMQYYCGHACF
jgi:hypothetical protein